MIEHAYIHIPFCIRKCHYCSFVSGLSIQRKKEYIVALLNEIKYQYKRSRLKTLYIGGGTPSLLDSKEIESIIKCFNFSNSAEITLEVNPETVEKEKFQTLKEIGINRISMGVQSFDDNTLKRIGRNHNEKEIYNAIDIIKNTGFKNINIDLIYGLPEQNINLFNTDIRKAINLDIQHIST